MHNKLRHHCGLNPSPVALALYSGSYFGPLVYTVMAMAAGAAQITCGALERVIRQPRHRFDHLLVTLPHTSPGLPPSNNC